MLETIVLTIVLSCFLGAIGIFLFGEMMAKFIAIVVTVVGTIVLYPLLGMLFAWPLMWLINCVFSPAFLTFMFGTAKIGFWQTVGLSVFCSVLLKSSSSSKE